MLRRSREQQVGADIAAARDEFITLDFRKESVKVSLSPISSFEKEIKNNIYSTYISSKITPLV